MIMVWRRDDADDDDREPSTADQDRIVRGRGLRRSLRMHGDGEKESTKKKKQMGNQMRSSAVSNSLPRTER